MLVSSLKLTNYRNFERAEFGFDREQTAVCGENARGKSNLLEAIYFLAIGKSGRGARDRDVLRWGAEFFSIEAIAESEGRAFPIRIAYDVKAGKKKAQLEDHPLTRLSELIGAFNAVLFSPEDVDLVLRDPPQRRRLLDILVSQSNASYLSDLEQYYRTLSQRNRLLKERGRLLLSDPAQLSAWDSQLAGIGARIVCSRMDALKEIQPLASENYGRIASTEETLKTVYRSVVGAEDQDRAEEILSQALRDRRPEEAELGFTLSGPHRDHLLFTLDGRSAHQFASKGQLKTALLAWKLAEARFLELQTGKAPVLLMDDVFSELDRRRALAVLELVADFGQVVLTSARDPDIGLGKRGYRIIDL